MKRMFVYKARPPLSCKNCLLLALLLSAFTLTAPASQQEAIKPQNLSGTDVDTLIKDGFQNWREQYFRYMDYTYKVRTVTRERVEGGKIREESFVQEGIFPNTKRPMKGPIHNWITVEKNGKPVPRGRISEEREKLGRRLERLEREAEETRPKAQWPDMSVSARVRGQFVKVFGESILKGYDFSPPQRETVGGREMFGTIFRPRPDAVFPEECKVAHHVEGKLWIDVADRVIARVTVWPKGTVFNDTSSDGLLRNAAAVWDWMRTREGAWLIRLIHVNGLKYTSLFPGIEIEYVAESFEHKYFKVEVEEERLNSPEK